jgi:hypothetical protein
VLEDVVLVVLQLAGVDLVEDLQQHEDVEEDGVVLAGLIVPLGDADRRRNAKQFGAYIGEEIPLKRSTPRMAICANP